MKLLIVVSVVSALCTTPTLALENCDLFPQTHDIAKRLACLQRNIVTLQKQIEMRLVQGGEWRCLSPGGTAPKECAFIKFEHEFKTPPRVFVGFTQIGAKGPGAAVSEQSIMATKVTTQGFTPLLSTMVGLSSGGTWIAIGEAKGD